MFKFQYGPSYPFYKAQVQKCRGNRVATDQSKSGHFFSRTGKGREILYLVGEIHNSCLKSGKSQAKVFILISVLNVTSHFTKNNNLLIFIRLDRENRL